MVKGVTDGPRVSQDFGNMRMEQPEEAKTSDTMTLPELNGILSELGLGTFGGDEQKVRRGSSEDTPRQDGPVRDRGEGVKNFFKKVGQGIGSFFSKIGTAFSSAFEAIKGALTSRTGAVQPQAQQTPVAQTQETPRPPALDGQGKNLKDFCETLSKDMETSYQDYLAHTEDEPPKTRSEFVKDLMPDPPGGIDQDALGFVGDRLDDVRANFGTGTDLDEMKDVIMDRLQEMPMLEITTGPLFASEIDNLNIQASTFLRGNSAFTKLDKFISREAVDFSGVISGRLDEQKDKIEEHGHLGDNNGLRMSMNSLTQEQADAVKEVADSMLDSMFDIDPDDQKSFFNSIPKEYRDFLSEKAATIMSQTNISPDERKEAVNVLYCNSLFLRGASPEMMNTAVKEYGGTTNQVFVVQASQMMQTFLNGRHQFEMGKGNDKSQAVLDHIVQTHQPRLEAFLQAIGMPVVPDDEAKTE